MRQIIRPFINKLLAPMGFRVVRLVPPPKVTFYDADEEYHIFHEEANIKTDMIATDNAYRRKRQYLLYKILTSSYFNTLLQYNVAECGTFKGLSAYQIANLLKNKSFNKNFYIFDSFEGLSEFKAKDIDPNNKNIDFEARRKEFSCSQDIVMGRLKDFDFISYHKGWIPERFEDVSEDVKFGLVHIDVDLYQPIYDCLEFFYPKMVSGGIIVLDDYGYLGFPGAKKAVDDFMINKQDLLLSFPSGVGFILKR